MSTQEEADKLRKEAKDLLNKLFCGALNIRPEPGDTVSISLPAVDRAVDCIIFASVLEVAALTAKAQSEAP